MVGNWREVTILASGVKLNLKIIFKYILCTFALVSFVVLEMILYTYLALGILVKLECGLQINNMTYNMG